MPVPEKREELNPAYTSLRQEILAMIPRQARVILDIGCSSGALGRALKAERPGARVIGIEIDEGAAAQACQALEQVHVADLNRGSLRDLLPEASFDVIIAADVLEHLIDPWTALRDAVALLKPGGHMVTSLPNVRHWYSVADLLLRGRWPTRDRGLHDRTHLRFFTRRSILEMLRQSGLEVVRERRNLRLFDAGTSWDSWVQPLDLPVLRSFLTYQYVHLSVRPRREAPASATEEQG